MFAERCVYGTWTMDAALSSPSWPAPTLVYRWATLTLIPSGTNWCSHKHKEREASHSERTAEKRCFTGSCSHFLFPTLTVLFFQSLVRPCVSVIDQFIWLPFNWIIFVSFDNHVVVTVWHLVSSIFFFQKKELLENVVFNNIMVVRLQTVLLWFHPVLSVHHQHSERGTSAL